MNLLELVTSTPIKNNNRKTNSRKLYDIFNEHTAMDKNIQANKIYSYISVKRKMYERTLKNSRVIGSARERKMAVAKIHQATNITHGARNRVTQYATISHRINTLVKKIQDVSRKRTMDPSRHDQTRSSL